MNVLKVSIKKSEEVILYKKNVVIKYYIDKNNNL